MTEEQKERYDALITRGLDHPLTRSEEDEINKLGKLSVEDRKRKTKESDGSN